MASPKRAPGGPVPFSIDPGSLPDDGSPVTFEQTFAKRLGAGNATQNPMSEEDFENSEWQLEYQLPDGRWTFLEVVRGRPYAHKMLDRKAGKYRATPIDRNGKPVDSLAKAIMVGDPSVISLHTQQPMQPPPQEPMRHAADESSNTLPPWMQILFQREAEERAESRRRTEEDARRREAWEREQALKEEARREREERLAEMRAERESIAAKEAADRNNALIMAGLQMMQSVMSTSKTTPAPARDDRIQELLLQHILTERTQETRSGGGLRESLDLLVTLDQVAQARADRLPPPAEAKEEEDMGSSMMKMLPMLLGAAASRGAGGSAPTAAAPALPGMNVDAMINAALQNPEVLARVASQNPEAIARTFSKVVKADKRIEEAVIKVLSEEDEEGDG